MAVSQKALSQTVFILMKNTNLQLPRVYKMGVGEGKCGDYNNKTFVYSRDTCMLQTFFKYFSQASAQAVEIYLTSWVQ